jgi:hypothetical protein
MTDSKMDEVKADHKLKSVLSVRLTVEPCDSSGKADKDTRVEPYDSSDKKLIRTSRSYTCDGGIDRQVIPENLANPGRKEVGSNTPRH